MEFVIAIVGVALAVWMIVGARARHRDLGVDNMKGPDDSDNSDNSEPPG